VANLQLTVPTQESQRAGARIKPREVRDWLDNLPYLNAPRAARAASEQLRLLNRQQLGAAARLEILGWFLHTFHRLDDSLPDRDSGAAALEPLLKRLSQDIGFGYKIVVNQLVNKRGGLMDFRSLPLALLGAIHTLSLQLARYYAGHQRAPRIMWSECLALYAHARELGKQQFAATLSGAGHVEIDAAFRLTALLRLSDPYHLDTGMLGVLQDYFRRHLSLAHILPATQTDDRASLFRLAENSDLVLDVTALMEQVDRDIAKLRQHKQASAIGMPATTQSTALLATLAQTLKHWRWRDRQRAQRIETHAPIRLVAGLDAAWREINRGRAFDPSLYLSAAQENVIDLAERPRQERTARQEAPVLACTTIDRSAGGVSLRYRGQPGRAPRVGQLVALNRPGGRAGDSWVLGVCRWLVEAESRQGFEIGVEYLAREPQAVVIRSEKDTRFAHHPAISAVQRRGEATVQTLILATSIIAVGDTPAVYRHGEPVELRCTELLESGPGFERFICAPQ
jgi:hypothetical protein